MNLKYLFSKFAFRVFHPTSLKNCHISKNAKVCHASNLVNVCIGRYSYIGKNNVCVNTKIGSFCSIAENCVIGGGAHPLYAVSTSPVFYSKNNIFKKNFSDSEFNEYSDTVIENDVWIGSNTLIKAGVKIHTGAVIGMGSVVTHDIPPYEIWAGNPAKLVKKRFDDNSIKKLLKSEWWTWNEIKLYEVGKVFFDVDSFLNNIK